MNGDTLQVIYTWPDGREEIRYERQLGTDDANKLMQEVDELQSRADYFGYESPYTYRFV